MPILFGRSRNSEDVDIIIEKLTFKQFDELWGELGKDFECIITGDPKEAYDDYLSAKHSVRFSIKKQFIPNMEMKFPKNDLDVWTLEKKWRVFMNGRRLFISPMELQIPFKLFLGSEKDIEDAKYLYLLFKGKLDKKLLWSFITKLKVEKSFKRYLR